MVRTGMDAIESARVFITCAATGETRVHTDKYLDLIEYQYTDGNYGCDCNRHIFFVRAGSPGIPTAEIEDIQCGEGRYRVDKIEMPDGSLIYPDGRG